MDEDKLLKARIKELAEASFSQNRYIFSHFLGAAELTVFYDMAASLSFVDYDTFGGNPCCERQMVRFGSESMFGYEEPFPISVLCIEPLMPKFAEGLGHRDYLGAIMNLGLERDVIGDILIRDKRAYVFCMDNIAGYIQETLKKVRHTNVKVSLTEGEIEALRPQFKETEVLVSSLSFDAVVAAVCRLSRSGAQELFRDKKVILNGRICENNSMVLKEEDVFSIRGYGKFIYKGCGKQTRKGKIYARLDMYQ